MPHAASNGTVKAASSSAFTGKRTTPSGSTSRSQPHSTKLSPKASSTASSVAAPSSFTSGVRTRHTASSASVSGTRPR